LEISSQLGESNGLFIHVVLHEQIQAGTFEFALNHLVDHELDLSALDARCKNAEVCASAPAPTTHVSCSRSFSLPTAAGCLFAPAVNDVLTKLGQMGRWGLMLLGGLLALFVAIRALPRHRFRVRLRMDGISVDALADMLAKGETPVVVDVRKTLMGAESRIPGAIVFSHDDWPADLQAADEDALVVGYGACPNEASAATVARKLMARGVKRVRPLEGRTDAWRAKGFAVVPATAA
jgi:rhodanese-related sulfurtransferase